MEQTPTQSDVQSIVQQAVTEYLRAPHRDIDYQQELEKERRRRLQLEQSVDALVEDNERARQAAVAEQRLP